MTRQETGIIMDILQAAYPQYYRGTSAEASKQVLNLWATMFTDEPLELVAGAVKRLIASDTKGFPPVIGQVKENIYKLIHPEEMSEEEAWALIRKAIRHTGASEEYAKLPPILQRLLGSPQPLRDWAVMDEETVNSVVSSNFKRSYRERRAEIKEYEKLPSDVKRLTDQLATGLLNGAEGQTMEQARKLLMGE